MLLNACKLGDDRDTCTASHYCIMPCWGLCFSMASAWPCWGGKRQRSTAQEYRSWPEQAMCSPLMMAGIGALLCITPPSAAARQADEMAFAGQRWRAAALLLLAGSLLTHDASAQVAASGELDGALVGPDMGVDELAMLLAQADMADDAGARPWRVHGVGHRESMFARGWVVGPSAFILN